MQLLSPKLGIEPRQRAVQRTLMPEAAVHEYCDLGLSKHNVDLDLKAAGLDRGILPESQPASVQCGPKESLWLRVTALIALH